MSAYFGDIYNGEEGVAVHNNTAGYIYLRILDSALTSLDAWRNYLDNENNKGTPITIWYYLNSATTEAV